MTITRRGFLSLCLSLPAIAKVPEIAEPIIKRPLQCPIPQATPAEIAKLVKNSMYGKMGNFPRVVRYSMALGSQVVEPGRIALLRATPAVDLIPERLLINASGFEVLHLRAADLEPMGDVEGLPSDVFRAASYCRIPMEYAKVTPEDEVILALVNRNKYAVNVAASVFGAAREEQAYPSI